MAKKSHKKLALCEKDNAGCMWGLISMLDFCEEYATRKLLLDKKHGNATAGTGYSKVKDLIGYEEKHINNNIDGSRSNEVNLGITTIKRLMEEEMNHKHLQNRSPNQEFQFIISDFKSVVQNRKNFREKNNDSKEIFNAVDSLTTIASMDNQQPESIDSTERTSANFDLAAFLIEFYGYSDKCQTIDVESNDIVDLCLSLKTVCEKLQSHHDPPHVMLDQKDSVDRALTGVAEDGVSKNSINEKQSDKKMHLESNELIDAFKILNSKRELLLKLLQDSDSPLFKYAHETRNTEVAKYSKLESDNNTEKVRLLHKENGSSEKYEETDSVEMSHKRSRTFFFWKKHKTKGTKPSGGSQSSHPLNRIVVLKPIPERKHRPPITILPRSSTSSKHRQGHEEDGKRVTSHFFSLNEIKRRLHAFLEKKTELMISRDSVLHKIPIGCKYSVETSNQFGNGTAGTRSARRSSCANEKSTDTLTIVKKKDKKPNADSFELCIRRDCASPKPGYLAYEEARNHLAKRRSIGDQINHLPTVQVSKSSGKILSVPGCSVPPFPTVENKKEISTFIMETEYSSMEHLAPKGTKSIVSSLKESLAVSSGSESKENSQLMMLDLKKQLIDGHIEEESYVQEGLNRGGSIELNKPKVDISIPTPYQSEVPTQSSTQELDNACNRFKEDYSTLELDSSEVKSQNAIQAVSSCSPIIKKLFTVDHTTEASGTTIVSEDITGQGRDVVHDKFQMQCRQPNFQYNDNSSTDLMLSDMENEMIRSIDENQARLEYVEAVLQAVGLTTTNGFSERWLLGDKLLDPSLFDEVRTSCCPVIKDPQLLFDCISDILIEIHERYFKYGLHPYFTNSSIHPVLSGEKLMKEVVMGVTRHDKMLLPKTVDEMIQKDLQNEAWIHFPLETESIAIDVCDHILDDMIEEAVFDLWF